MKFWHLQIKYCKNNLKEKLKHPKWIKESNNQVILSRKKYLDWIISSQSEKLNYNTFNSCTKNTDLLTVKKKIKLSISKMPGYKS